MKKKKYLFLIFLFIFSFNSFAQNVSNEGKEFWVCFPAHVPASGRNDATLSVFITSKNSTSGVVSCGNFSQSFSVIANRVTEVLVPRSDSYVGDGTGIVPNKGIKVLIDEGKPKAVVYAHVFAGARSAATLVLPVLALGQKYFAMSYNQSQELGKSQIDIVCVEPNTILNITPRVNGVVQRTFSVTLTSPGDVYQYQNDSDITGTYIEVDASTSSCKRFAAFSGSSALAIFSPGCIPPGGNTTNSNPSYDPLFQQLYPLESWGTSFPLIPFFDRNIGAIFRVLASEDNTSVQINGITVIINKGQFYTTNPVTAVSVITSDKPVTVAQYAITQYCADSRNRGNSFKFSDPDMVIINPLEYSIKNVTMYSSTKLEISDQFLNVMIPSNGVSSFKINGVNYSNRFSQIPNNSGFSFAQINLGNIGGSNFNLVSDVGFNAMAYGFGNFESYAYSAGTNLASSVFINAVRPATNEIIPNACLDEDFDFRLVLPYMSTKLIWTLDIGDDPITQEDPTAIPINVNGKVLFEYRLPVSKSYDTVGTKRIQIISTIPPSSGGCPSGDEILNFDFEVYLPPPVVAFAAVDESCVNTPVNYNLRDNNSGTALTYFWDFGDGTFSNEENPVHIFTTTGVKTVSLYVKNDVACISNVFSLPINIYLQPIVQFESEDINCTNVDIQFNNKTDLKGNTPLGYLWDFGDGTTSTDENPVHQFEEFGNYKVTLAVTTQGSCVEIGSNQKFIYQTPTAEIEDPKSCVNDTVQFRAINKSTGIVSYKWDFGDGSTSTDENPSHKYSSTGNYTIKLEIISDKGCENLILKTISINAANPRAEFSVLGDNLCSNVPVQFQDMSEVSFGNITKLEWIYEYSTSGANSVVTVLNPQPQDVYEHKYPASGLTKNYQVVLRAYSGNICFSEFGPISITVKGSPEVQFNTLQNVCLDATPFLITQASELTKIAGNGIFTGTGVNNNGLFDPQVSGVGTFEITYTFVADNGCSDVKTQNIEVFPLPLVDAGPDATILFGGQVTLKASASGKGVNYKWTPSIGLNSDNVLNPIASPKETTLYSLIVTSEDGCVVSDQMTVIVAGLPNIPNTFTPNSDAVNDSWNIKYLETYVNVKVVIFNRFGNEVFTSYGYGTPWDGKSEGREVPMGVYYYVIDPRNGEQKFTGSVTVIR